MMLAAGVWTDRFGSLKSDHGRAPGKPGTESVQQDEVAATNPPLAAGFIEGHRNGRYGRVAGFIEVDHNPFHRYSETLCKSNDDTAIGLMRNHQRYVFDCQTGVGQSLTADLFHRPNGNLEHFFAVHRNGVFLIPD